MAHVKSSQTSFRASIPCILPTGGSGFAVGIVNRLPVRVRTLEHPRAPQRSLHGERCAVINRIGRRLNHRYAAEALVEAVKDSIANKVSGIPVQVNRVKQVVARGTDVVHFDDNLLYLPLHTQEPVVYVGCQKVWIDCRKEDESAINTVVIVEPEFQSRFDWLAHEGFRGI